MIAKDTWRLTIDSKELAGQVRPSQFFMVRIANRNDPLIGRAFALYDMHRDASGQPSGLSVVYTVKGKFTTALSRMVAGDEVEFWGPLGNTFSCEPVDHLILVAGGVGQTPMLTVTKEALGREGYGGLPPAAYAKRVTLIYGARTQSYLSGLEEFHKHCSEVRIATEDGSLGTHGRVTDVLEALLQSRASDETCRIDCCGPEPMMHATAQVAERFGVPCEVSLETPMACGIGICFTCVAKVEQPDGEWDYKRTCIEGPVFDAQAIHWETACVGG
jgi:dihydroorotate dehydrogenase electron transfer subunit